MSIPSSPVPPSGIPQFTSTDPLVPSSTVIPGLISTLTAAEQEIVNAVIQGSIKLSPSTTALFQESLTGLNELAHNMHIAYFLDAIRAMQSRSGQSSLADAYKRIQQQLLVDFKAAVINIDEINTTSDVVNAQAIEVANAVPGYNAAMNQLETYLNSYNQARNNLAQARNTYNGSPSSLTNYQNALSAFNTAANNYNDYRLSLINAQPGQAAYAVKNYQEVVDRYNSNIALLGSYIEDKNAQINQLNTLNLLEDPLYPQAELHILPTPPLGQIVQIPTAQSLFLLSTVAVNTPPPKVLDKPVFSDYNPIGFTFTPSSNGYAQAPYPSPQLNSLIQQWNNNVASFNNNLSLVQNQRSTVTTAINNVNVQGNKLYTTNPMTNQFSTANYNAAVGVYNQTAVTYNGYISNLNNSITNLQNLGAQINALIGQGEGSAIPSALIPQPGDIPPLLATFIPSTLGASASPQSPILPGPAPTVTSTLPPPQSLQIPPQMGYSFNDVTFTPGDPLLPNTPTYFSLALEFFIDTIKVFFNFITNFSSLDQAITIGLKSQSDKSLVLLHSFLSSGEIPLPPKSTGQNSQLQSTGSSAGFIAAGKNSTDSADLLNNILRDQSFQNVLNVVMDSNPGLKQLFGALPENLQAELLAVLGDAKAGAGLLSVQLLQNLIQSGVNISDQLNGLTNAVALLKIFLSAIEGGNLSKLSAALGLGVTGPQEGLQAKLTAQVLAATILGQAVGNQNLLLSGLLISLHAEAPPPTSNEVAQNIHQLQIQLSSQQSSIFQKQLQSSLTAALSSGDIAQDAIVKLSQQIVNATSPAAIANAINNSLAAAGGSELQSALRAANLAASLLGLDIENDNVGGSGLTANLLSRTVQNSEISTRSLNASLILSATINSHTQKNIQNSAEVTLQANKVPNAHTIASEIALSIAEISQKGLPTAAFLTEVNNTIQKVLGTDNPVLAKAISDNVHTTIFTQNVSQAILENFQNKNLILNTTDIASELAEIIQKIGSSFRETLHKVAQENDDVYLKKTTDSFRITIVRLLDFNKFVEEVLSPGKTFVGLMYDGMKEGFHKGWLDFAV